MKKVTLTAGILAALVLALTGPESASAQGPNLASQATSDEGSSQSPSMSLREAYKREFAFLAGQKRQLEARLEQVEAQTSNEERQLQRQLQGLESKLLALEERRETMRDRLSRVEQSKQSSIDDEQLLEATLQQARTTLADYGVQVAEAAAGDDRSELLADRFNEAVALLGRLSSLTERPGSFFAKTGTKVEGRILQVGRVAAYGVSDGSAGALAPAGGGRLKIWKDADGSTARALASGEDPETLSIFLFESLDGQVDDGKGESLLQHVASGGAIGWVIVTLGGLGLLLVIIRALLLGAAARDPSDLEHSVGSFIQNGEYSAAIDQAKRSKGSAGRVVATVVTSLKAGANELEDVVSESMLSEHRRLHRFGTIILVIAAVAPLLGLLGTVTGMISTFDVITKYGTGDPKMLSGGISTALVTTELGLIVAIPTLLLGNLLRGWGEGIETNVERVVLRVVNIHRDAQMNGSQQRGSTES